MSASVTLERDRFGDLVRYWRRVRAMSQLDLAAAASTTPRYMSFVETGRSQPSREMVLRLAAALDVPLRDRNGLLVAAGFAPIYPEHDLDHPAIDRVMAALDRVLEQHAPYPAVVMNRRWDVVRVNAGAARLFAGLCAPDPVPDPANVLRLMLEPGPVRAAVENWNEVAPSLLERARREAVGGVLDLATADLVHRLRTGADATVFAAAPRSIAPLVPVIDVQFNYGDTTLRWFSIVSTIGTPVDITAQELRLEAFFPSDDDTAARWRLSPTPPDDGEHLQLSPPATSTMAIELPSGSRAADFRPASPSSSIGPVATPRASTRKLPPRCPTRPSPARPLPACWSSRTMYSQPAPVTCHITSSSVTIMRARPKKRSYQAFASWKSVDRGASEQDGRRPSPYPVRADVSAASSVSMAAVIGAVRRR